MRREKRVVLGYVAPIALVAAIVAAGALPAGAVPVFARKYHTSCQTCHSIFPKLNPFGQAFRLNGYRMPGETEDQVKEEPVSLGAKAYEKVWPKNVWPSDLPSNVPFALNVKLEDLVESHDDSGAKAIRNDFQFPAEVNLFAAGTLGKNFGFLAEVTYEEAPDGSAELGIERAQLHVNSPFGPEHAVNFKLGKFAPDLEDGFHEMWIMTANGIDTLFAYNPIGIRGGSGLSEEDAGISLPGSVQGVEMYGVASHRLFYTLGIVNGLGPGEDSFDGNNKKDFFARVDYKFGGLCLDGHGDSKQSEKNWREDSFRIGAFGYLGDGTDIPFDITDDEGNPFQMEDRRFERLGLFASWYFRDLNVFGVAMRGRDRLQLMDAETGEDLERTTPSYDAWFVQADYVIVPPFQASLRYEQVKPADAAADNIEVLNADFSFLIRANIKAMLEYNRDLQNSENHSLAAVLRFAY